MSDITRSVGFVKTLFVGLTWSTWGVVCPQCTQSHLPVPTRIQFKFDERKAVQAAGRLINQSGGEMNYMALIKLLYLVDRAALLRWGKTVTGDSLVAMKCGMVLSNVFDRVSQKKQSLPNTPWHQVIPRPAPYVYTVRFSGLPDTSALSEAEVALIDETFAAHRHMDENDLVELTHQLPEWQDPGKSSQRVSYEEILAKAKKSPEEISGVAEESQADIALANIFK